MTVGGLFYEGKSNITIIAASLCFFAGIDFVNFQLLFFLLFLVFLFSNLNHIKSSFLIF